MKNVLEKLKKLKSNEIEPNILKTTLDSFDFAQVDYMSYLGDIDIENIQEYGRVLLMESPIKVFLTYWPAQNQLPAHQHNNFWGYVAVLKGLLTETTFVFDEDKNTLSCHPPKSYRKGEVVFEPLNVIHHIQNPSPSKPLVTAHFYFPPVYDYKGVKMFDIKKRMMAELNESAPGVSWEMEDKHFGQIHNDAFEVVNLW